MSNYPDDFNDAAFERAWGESEPVDTRNEDDVIESRKKAKETKMFDMSKGITEKGVEELTVFLQRRSYEHLADQRKQDDKPPLSVEDQMKYFGKVFEDQPENPRISKWEA